MAHLVLLTAHAPSFPLAACFFGCGKTVMLRAMSSTANLVFWGLLPAVLSLGLLQPVSCFPFGMASEAGGTPAVSLGMGTSLDLCRSKQVCLCIGHNNLLM